MADIEATFAIFDLSQVKALKSHIIDRLTRRIGTFEKVHNGKQDIEIVDRIFTDLTHLKLMRPLNTNLRNRLLYLKKNAERDYDRNKGFNVDADFSKYFDTMQVITNKKIAVLEELKELRSKGWGTIGFLKPNKQKYDAAEKALLAESNALRNTDTSYYAREEFLLKICRHCEKYRQEINILDLNLKNLKKELSAALKADKIDRKVARADAADQKVRDTVGSFRTKIEKPNLCIYCSRKLGDSPHLDHIHPVSKGGLNIDENLVWCCGTCNIKKSDKGLFQFCREQKFDYMAICEKLLTQGKHV